MIDSRLVERVRSSTRILAFCGAGVSTASGIPDFRGPGGMWTRRQPVYYQAFLASDAARIEYWDYKLETWDLYRHAQPNAVHHALVALERAGKLSAVVTQNVDGLHRRAGTSSGLLAAYVVVNRGPTEHDGHPAVTLRLDGDVTALVPPAIDAALAD